MNIKISLLALFIGSAMMFSCQKEDSTPIKKEQVSNNNYLSFKDRNSFETASNSKDLKSLRTVNFKSLKQSPNNLGIDNEFLLSVLSPEGEIQIGQWLFKLNGFNRSIKLLNPQTKAVIGNFTFDDDVLDLLENGITSTPSANQRVNLFCGESGVSREYHDEEGERNFYVIHYSDGREVSAGTVTNYTKLGIYFELRVKWGVFWEGKYSDAYDGYHEVIKQYKFKPKCKSGHSERVADFSTDYPDWVDLVNANGYGANDKVYGSTTALAKYWSKVDLTFYSHGIESFSNEINHGY